MSQFYSDPSRENETYALPDAETFYAEAGEWAIDENGERCDVVEGDETQEVNEAGWYYWFCFPGCLPEGDPMGPYETEAEAIEACREDYAPND